MLRDTFPQNTYNWTTGMYMKSSSTSLVLRKIQVKAQKKYHFIPIIIAVIKRTRMGPGGSEKKREALYNTGGKVKDVVIMEDSIEVSQSIETQLPYTQAILLWDTHTDKSVR